MIQQIVQSPLSARSVIVSINHPQSVTEPIYPPDIWEFTGVCSSPVMTDNEKYKQLVNKTCQYLQEHITETYTLDQLAHIMATNRNSLSMAFKAVLNQGVFAWLRQVRLKKAKQLLTSTQLPIQQVCYQVGYNDPANFATAFKKIYQLSPMQYRKKVLDSNITLRPAKAVENKINYCMSGPAYFKKL